MLSKKMLVLILLIPSCGDISRSAEFDSNVEVSTGGSGAVKAIVLNSKSFSPNISHGQIVQYKVTVSAIDLEVPIVAAFDATAESGVVSGIPVGKNRIVKVEALNQNNAIIRDGETLNLEIKAGTVTEAVVQMLSVPVFANLSDGNSVPNTRFKALVFSDEKNPVSIEDEFDGVALPLFDVSANMAEVYPDISTGLASFLPALLPAGEHKFTARDIKTGRETSVTLYLADGEKRAPAMFYSAGTYHNAVLGSLGISY